MYRSCLTGETFSCKILIFLHIFHTTIFSVFYSKASKINFFGLYLLILFFIELLHPNPGNHSLFLQGVEIMQLSQNCPFSRKAQADLFFIAKELEIAVACRN